MLKKSQGLTLVELMIALAISLVIIAAFITSFIISIRGSRVSVELGRLSTELNHVISLMTIDLRRAGYWGGAGSTSDNPYMDSTNSAADFRTDLQVNASNNCILFAYDKDGSGTAVPGIGANDERYGFRLNSTTQAIEYRPEGASFSCNAADWNNLTNPDHVEVTAFNVTINTESVDIDGTGPGTDEMQVRSVDISITGQLTKDPAVTKTLNKQIKIYNDRYQS